MSGLNRNGRLRIEPSNACSIRLPDRVWKLVQKASKGSRSVKEYIQTLIENDLIKRKMHKKSERKKISSKNFYERDSVMIFNKRHRKVMSKIMYFWPFGA